MKPATGEGFRQDDNNGTWDLNQSRTSNDVNEITDITETGGSSPGDACLQCCRQHDHHAAACHTDQQLHSHLRRMEPAG
ncbi:MAG: hypothetical protein R3C59_23260 [Planctomycetaceae bacterium]